jgi:hypothetical protein
MVRLDEMIKALPPNAIAILGGEYLREFRKGKKNNYVSFFLPEDVANIREWHYILLAIKKEEWEREIVILEKKEETAKKEAKP